MKAMMDHVKYDDQVFIIGRHDVPDAILIKFPTAYNKKMNEITNLNAYSASFDFLANEPDLYRPADLKKRYE